MWSFRFAKKKSQPEEEKTSEEAPKEAAEQDSNKAADAEPMPDNENKEAEKEVETEPVESRFEVPAAEAVADGETVDVKPTDEEKKTKKTTKDKLVSSLSFLKKKLPKKKQ